MNGKTRLAILLFCSSFLTACGSSVPVSEGGAATGKRLAAVKNWLYVLQGTRGGTISSEAIARAGYDLVVTDHSKTGGEEGIFSFREVERMKESGKRSLVLAYLSIGEAESYRYYWCKEWSRGERPRFIGPVNEDWEGNFWVRYWDEGWRSMLFGSASAYLDRILAAGFDGIYVDKIDAYQEVPDHVRRAERSIDPRAEMIRLVSDLSAYARAKRPGFLVVGQNAEELLVDPVYLRAIDGVGKEELWFAATDRAQSAEDRRDALAFLKTARRAGKLVLTVDYCTGENARIARKSSRDAGFVPFISEVELSAIPLLAKDPSEKVE